MFKDTIPIGIVLGINVFEGSSGGWRGQGIENVKKPLVFERRPTRIPVKGASWKDGDREKV